MRPLLPPELVRRPDVSELAGRNAGVKLSPSESERLGELEDQIGHGMQTFWQVGTALLEIRDARLYRAGWRTFEEYLRGRWGVSESHGYRLMASAEVVNSLVDSSSPIGEEREEWPLLPKNEAQARPLAGLPGDVAQAAWAAAVTQADGAQPTAADVEAAVQDAIAALPPERQRQVVEAEEKAVIGRSKERQQKRQRETAARLRKQHLAALAKARRIGARRKDLPDNWLERYDSLVTEAGGPA